MSTVTEVGDTGLSAFASSRIWANRDFMRLWVAQALSQTAQNAVWYGILVAVLKGSESTLHMGLAITTLVLPSVLFGVIAGVYVDRWDKRWVLIGSNALRVGIVLCYALTQDLLLVLYLINFAFATTSQFFAPAEVSVIPSLVQRKQLMQANSLFHLTFTGSHLAGLVILGPLIVGLVGVDGLFVAVAAMFAVCALLVWPLPSFAPQERANGQSPAQRALRGLWADVREVGQFFRSDALVSLSVVHWTLGSVLGIVLAMLAPGYVVTVLGIRAEDSVFVLAPAGVGMVAGTLVLSRYATKVPKQPVINAALLSIAGALGVLAVVADVWRVLSGLAAGAAIPNMVALVGVIMLLALVAGVALVSIIVPSQTTLQERAAISIRGRVFAIALMLGNLISIMPLLFLGTLADIVGVDVTLLVLACIVAAIAVGSLWATRRLRGLIATASAERPSR